MIIYGWKQYAQVLAVLTLVCQQCHMPAEHVLRRWTTKFTLFFIPLFPIGRKRTLQCGACEHEVRISKEQADQLAMSATGQSPMPPQPQPAYGSPQPAYGPPPQPAYGPPPQPQPAYGPPPGFQPSPPLGMPQFQGPPPPVRPPQQYGPPPGYQQGPPPMRQPHPPQQAPYPPTNYPYGR